MRLVLVPPSTTVVNTQVPVEVPSGILRLAQIARRMDGVECILQPVPLYYPDRRALEGAALTIAWREPDVVGFSTWCHTYPAQVALAQELARIRPQCRILFGGPQATATDVETLRAFPFVDLVARGEAEVTFPRLLTALAASDPVLDDIPGLSFRRGDQIVRTGDATPVTDLDALPWPAYDLMPPREMLYLDSGRGCPYACKYCSTSVFFRRQHRLRSPASILDEMEYVHRRYGTRIFHLTCDSFTVNRRYVEQFCEAFRARALPVRWGCMTRVDCVDAPLLQLMADSGCLTVLYGIESGSPAMQRSIGKRLNVAQVRQATEGAVRAGLMTYCSFILGFPDETPEDLAQTLAMMQAAVALGAKVYAHTLAVMPDTAYAREYGAQLRYDGEFSSTSMAYLGAAEEALVRAHPDIFSPFYYLPSPAASRPALLAATRAGMLLNWFRFTLLLLDSATPERNVYQELCRRVDSGQIPIGRPEDCLQEGLLRVLAEQVAAAAPEGSLLREVFALEREVLLHRQAELDPEAAGIAGTGSEHDTIRKPRCCFTLTASYDLAAFFRSGNPEEATRARHDYLIQPVWDGHFRLYPLSPEKRAAYEALHDGSTIAEARQLLARYLPSDEASRFLDNCLQYWVLHRLGGAR